VLDAVAASEAAAPPMRIFAAMDKTDVRRQAAESTARRAPAPPRARLCHISAGPASMRRATCRARPSDHNSASGFRLHTWCALCVCAPQGAPLRNVSSSCTPAPQGSANTRVSLLSELGACRCAQVQGRRAAVGAGRRAVRGQGLHGRAAVRHRGRHHLRAPTRRNAPRSSSA